ncbi:MAG: acetyl-CoA hydrolase, partial [Deltaproteobacteria bacterium]|nr:acetyl-CoA hydrolase [Deltaproteobacteria bacterium]
MTHELSSELDLTRIIRPHDNLVWAQGSGEPVTLVERLVEQRHKIGAIRAFIGGMALSDSLKPEHTDRIAISALGAVGTLRSLSRAGALHILPIHLSQLPGYLLNGAIGSEVVFLHLSAPDEQGRYSYSLANDYLQFAMKRARVVIAEINDQAPWTNFGGALEPSRIDYTVRVSRPIMQIAPAPFGEIERQIAKYVSDYVDDGATIQVGIGAIPDAVLAGLADHRDLGFHSGLLTDRVLDLIKHGVITNARKPIDTGISVCVTLLGTKRLYEFAHKNSAIKLHTLMYTHRPEILSQLDHFVAINSAVESDLTG